MSLDDRLLRLFGGDQIFTMMQNIGFQDDTPIQSPILNKSLESAQKKVEAYFPEEKNNSPVHKPRRLRHTTFYQANSYFNQWIMLKIKMWGRKLSSDLRAYIS